VRALAGSPETTLFAGGLGSLRLVLKKGAEHFRPAFLEIGVLLQSLL
jgi:hypothetical protein